MIDIQENVSLKNLTTLNVGGAARFFVLVKTEEELISAFTFVKSRKLPIFIIGGGSNLLIDDHGFSGLVVKIEIKGIKFVDQNNDNVILEIGAGEILDDAVSLSVFRNLSGLENLSGIPGTVGGAVVQNAGAYGVEIKDILHSVAGVNSSNGKKFIFTLADYEAGYRTSIFKKNKKYIITTVKLILSKKPLSKINYASLNELLNGALSATPNQIREAVLKIRNEKLPDWHKIGTAGSFFVNPTISLKKYEFLKSQYPELPSFPAKLGFVKVSLAWILDHICHLKAHQTETVGLYKNQPLVFVNLGNATAKEIIDLAEEVKNIVKEKTGIEIVQEVEIVK